MNDSEELFRAARRGDSAASEQLFGRLRGKLLVIAASRLRGRRREEHEDLVHESLRTIFEKLAEVEDGIELYALKVLRNKLGSAYQEHDRREFVSFAANDDREGRRGSVADPSAEAHNPWPEHEAEIERKRQAEAIVAAMRHLPEYCRIILSGLLAGYAIGEIWQRVQGLEPKLKRNAFDRRVFGCKSKVKLLIAGGAA